MDTTKHDDAGTSGSGGSNTGGSRIGLFRPGLVSKNIFKCMHRALNIDEKEKLIAKFICNL
jgi:hypothetical protein